MRDPHASSARRRPKLILSFVRQNNSADEQAFIEHWRKVADKIHITDLHNWAGTLNKESDVNYPCYRPWLTFTVLWDGRVSLCCADFDGRNVLGDLNTSTIQEIWNAEPTGTRAGASRERRPGHLPLLRPAAQGLSALGHQARLSRGSAGRWPSIEAYTGSITLLEPQP